MGKYGDIQYLIDRPEPINIFLQARQIAGFQLQEQFKIYNKGKKIHMMSIMPHFSFTLKRRTQ